MAGAEYCESRFVLNEKIRKYTKISGKFSPKILLYSDRIFFFRVLCLCQRSEPPPIGGGFSMSLFKYGGKFKKLALGKV